ncbi:hypothetical protein TIFTF001_018403 [Ficus carica]|uniref:Uncharacterized protein n=1 Tax=Ficus carica TaxID=3494 RepID=A0AA88AVG6_FICCA|nr:hypothetical protein TIFTF001_018403 [Ficus carica]
MGGPRAGKRERRREREGGGTIPVGGVPGGGVGVAGEPGGMGQGGLWGRARGGYRGSGSGGPGLGGGRPGLGPVAGGGPAFVAGGDKVTGDGEDFWWKW